MKIVRILILSCAFIAFAISQAWATFDSQPMLPVGESATLMGGAVTAAVNDSSSTWYNPAGLGRVRTKGISANVSVYGIQKMSVPGFLRINNQSDPVDIKGSGVAVFPSYLGYMMPLDGPSDSTDFLQAIGISIVVPDYEKMEIMLDAPARRVAEDYSQRIRATQQTFWINPGWGGCWRQGRFCLGAGAMIAYRTEYSLQMGMYRVEFESNNEDGYYENLSVEERDIWATAIGGLFGVQTEITDGFRIGVSFRTPLSSIAGGGTALSIDAQSTSIETSVENNAVRRVEDQNLRVKYRLPAQFRLGGTVEQGPLHLSADIVMSLRQSAFAFVRGKNGELTLPALSASDDPIGPPIEIYENRYRGIISDFAIGAGLVLSERITARGGLFTQNSGETDPAKDFYGNRWGITFGISRKGEKSIMHIGATIVNGGGNPAGIEYSNPDDPSEVQSSQRRAHYFAAYLNIGGTTDL